MDFPKPGDLSPFSKFQMYSSKIYYSNYTIIFTILIFEFKTEKQKVNY